MGVPGHRRLDLVGGPSSESGRLSEAVAWANMNAIKIDTMISEAIARAIPALRPLLGKHVELIALDAAPALPSERKLIVDASHVART